MVIICCDRISLAKIPQCCGPVTSNPDQYRSRVPFVESELGVRPIYHQLERRADAHVLIAFLAYCLQVTLKNQILIHAPGLTPASVFEKLSMIQMVEVWIPTVDGRWLVLPRHTQPEKDVQAVLDQLRLELPCQPPPRIKARQIPSVAAPANPVL